MKYIPTSNSPGPDGSPYYGTSIYSQTLHDYKEAGRVDANMRYGSLFAYYFMDNDSVDNPYYIKVIGTHTFQLVRTITMTSSHRRFFHGPGINSTDLALLRDFHVYHEHTVQFRAEAFNVFTHTQFNNPGGNYTNQPSFGKVTSAKDPRIMQVA